MFLFTIRSIFRQWLRPSLLALGLLSISTGGVLIAAASQITILTVDRELSQFWRTSYDILVRPAGARSPIEEKYGLVEANHLSGIWGGITFEQYEAIRAIPGVEVAAPIAMIGYVTAYASSEGMSFAAGPGAYVVDSTATVNDGCRTYTPPGFPQRTFAYYEPGRPRDQSEYNRILRETGIVPHDTSEVNSLMVGAGVPFPILMAGIDPPQEAALVPVDGAILQGRYLRPDESLEPKVQIVPSEGSDAPVPQPINLPILINTTTYVDLLHRAEMNFIVLPPEVGSLDEILANGGAVYLETLPTEAVASTQAHGKAIYERMVGNMTAAKFLQGAYAALSTPSGLVYQESAAPFPHEGLVLALQLPPGQEGQAFPQYRASLAPGEAEFDVQYFWDVIGVFDIERIPQPAEVSGVPLETYFPPAAILRYDEQGAPVQAPCSLRPTLNAEGYIQPPPLVLTTLQAAQALRGDEAISAIRVRVSDINRLTPAAQRKIEAIAIEIAKQTGLTVDIMVGSSPTRVLVHVPGIGYVEEQWIKKGVNLTYKQGIQTGNWLLLMTLLAAGSLFTLDMTWAEVIAQRRVIALQKALGWRSRTVFGQVVGRVLLLGAVAISVGTLGAWWIARLIGWQVPVLLAAFPLAVLGGAILASLLPAWIVSRVPPIAEIQRGGLRYRRMRLRPGLGVWSYAWSGLMRRPGRTLLAGMAAALSAALLVLLLGVTLEQRAMLSGTLLGEFILVRIEGFHYAIVGIGLGLATLSTANALLGSIVERRREIGVLKAVGWRDRTVAGLFIAEGALLGLTAGMLGALLGSVVFFYLYGSPTPTLALVILLGAGIPGLVGAVAAFYPARLAAQVPPAEAVRYE